ncbi:ROK family protein [Cellulomonas sp. P24]|uniref:ROK family protein n=1 Tax=Cellulomonas sp. P24 TaxID=2885206 RepID=UPI00216B4B08|nr:ROK family protein [Cellulomonas sp. P24]MCR6493563.1 ROK family protein [Cellulomonas sp. P24]
MPGGHVTIGVDVGGTRLRVIGQDAQARRSTVREIAVPRTVPELVEALGTLIDDVAQGRRVSQTAIGLPGQTTSAVPQWVPNLRFLDGSPLASVVAARVGGDCVLVNDAQAALVAEAHEGAAVGHSSVVLVAVGTGIGGALMLDGHLVRGARGCAGAFGWLSFDGATADADHGAWEQVASGAALERHATPWGGVAAMIAAAREGDAAAVAAMSRFGALLGTGIAALASTFDPDVIVLAGGLVVSLDLIEHSLVQAQRDFASPAGRTVPVVAAALGTRAGVIGALRVALEMEVNS